MSKKSAGPRREYMTRDQKEKLGDQKRTHQNCKEATGVNRPGKTAQDKARGHVPYIKNRRFPDDNKPAGKK